MRTAAHGVASHDLSCCLFSGHHLQFTVAWFNTSSQDLFLASISVFTGPLRHDGGSLLAFQPGILSQYAVQLSMWVNTPTNPAKYHAKYSLVFTLLH